MMKQNMRKPENKNSYPPQTFFLQSSWYLLQHLQYRILKPAIATNGFSVPSYLPFCWKFSSIHHGVYIQDNLLIPREFSLKSQSILLCAFIFHYYILSVTSFSIFTPLSPQDSSILDIISDSIEMTLSLLPCVNIFVFGDFNVHHDTWLKHSNVTDVFRH